MSFPFSEYVAKMSTEVLSDWLAKPNGPKAVLQFLAALDARERQHWERRCAMHDAIQKAACAELGRRVATMMHDGM